jgi:hypothetical protein
MIREIDNYRFEETKTKKIYTHKQVLMYENYYYLRALIKRFGEIGAEPFGSWNLDYDRVNYTDEDREKIYSGGDPNNKITLSLEEFIKDIK